MSEISKCDNLCRCKNCLEQIATVLNNTDIGVGIVAPTLLAKGQHVADCACGPCFWAREKTKKPETMPPRLAMISTIDSLLETAAATDRKILSAKKMCDIYTEENFVKNLIKKVQGIEFNGLCPHGQPFYSCMPCSQ